MPSYALYQSFSAAIHLSYHRSRRNHTFCRSLRSIFEPVKRRTVDRNSSAFVVLLTGVKTTTMADENSHELSRLWRIMRTTKQMCADRVRSRPLYGYELPYSYRNQGYELTDEECNISLADFRAQYADETGAIQRAKMGFTARPTADMIKKYTPLPRPGQPEPEADIGTIHVQFNNDSSLGVKQLKAFAQLLSEKNYKSGIFITAAKATSSAMKIIPSILPTVMEVFQEEDLLVNISRHELVPKHTLLSSEDKKRLLERYRLKETQLPRIRQDDPMAKYLGLRRGQVVKIIRKSETAGRYASYRWVI